MLRRVLVPLDGSPFAESALGAAIALARQTDGSIRVVHVLDPGLAIVLPEQSERARAACAGYFESVLERVRGFWQGPVTTAIRQGRVAEELEAEVRDWGADVIAMSTHGRSGISRLWMGSVADRCLRAAVCPVILVRPSEGDTLDPARFDVSRVVLPLDGSARSERALEYGVALASGFDAQILLLRVVTQPGGVELSHRQEAIDALASARAQDRAEATEYVNDRVADLRRAGVRAYGVVWTEPGPAEAIAERSEGDWVVMATEGRSGFDRAVFGSVADKVIRSSRHPVLVVPPPRRSSLGNADEETAPGTTRSLMPQSTSAASGES